MGLFETGHLSWPWVSRKKREEDIPAEVDNFADVYPELVGPRMTAWIAELLECRNEALQLGAKQEKYIIELRHMISEERHDRVKKEMQLESRLKLYEKRAEYLETWLKEVDGGCNSD